MTMKKRITSFALVLLMVLSSLAVLLPVTGVKAAATGETKTYTKVTTAPTDWSGKYLIVYEKSETEGYAFNGVDASKGGSYKSLTIADNKIVSNDSEIVEFVIEVSGSGYSILISGGTNKGKYLAKAQDKNGIDFSQNAAVNSINIDANGVNIIGSGKARLRFNAGTNDDRFRYYKSTTYTAQQPIQLYKLEEASEHVHAYNDTWSSDNEYHWHQCINDSKCTVVDSKAAHTPDTTVSAYTKGTDTANHYFKCATCGEEYSVAHSSDTYHLTEDKSQHYQKCDVCNAEFNKGEHHVTAWTDTTDGANHSGTCTDCKNTVTKAHVVDEAYATNETEHWHICNECDAEVNKEAHSFGDDGVCTVCSYDKNGSKENDVTITFTDVAAVNNKITYEDKIRGLTATFDKSNGSSVPKWYTEGVRAYAKNTISFEVTSGTIRKIVITFGDGDKTNTITSDLGEYKDGTWTGSATKVVFTIGGSSGHRRFASAVVTLAESGACEHAYTYTSNNDGTHNGVCSLCSNKIENEACVYTTTVSADGTNTFTCDKCGYAKTYTPAELVAAIKALGSDEYFVGNCILTGYISDIRYPYTNTNKTPSFTIMVAGEEVYCFKATGSLAADFVLGDVVTLSGKMMNFKGNTVEFDQAEITACKKTISSATLNIGTNIDVNYYVVLPEGISYEKYVMRFTFNGKTTNVESTTGDKFTFKNVGPHQMGLNISAVLYGVNGETETKLSEKTTYSVKENLESLLTNENETVNTLAKNMLIYGAAAQKYTGAADADLVTSETHTATPNLTTSGLKVKNDATESAVIKFVGMKLIFDNEPILAIRYVIVWDDPDLTITANDITFKDGNDNVLAHDGEYVYLNSVTANKFGTNVTVKNDLDTSEVLLNVNTYIYYILNSTTASDNMKALATALYYYGVAAEAYVNAQTTQQ